MKTSVAIPSLGRSTLRATLKSLERQTTPPGEVLVINQGPEDLSELLELDLPIRVVNQDERGVANARSLALKEFTGDWILFTDDDQEVNAEWVEQLGHLAVAYPQASFFGGSVIPPINYDRKTECVGHVFIPGEILVDPDSYLRPFGTEDMLIDVWGGNYALNRTCVDKVGIYDGFMGRGSALCSSGEDTDYALRMVSKGLTGVLSCRLVVYHTFGARPIAESTMTELIQMSAAIRWKAARDPEHVHPELADRLQSFGRKKAQVCRLTGGVLFEEHGRRKSIYDEFWEQLEAGFDVKMGRIVAKES